MSTWSSLSMENGSDVGLERAQSCLVPQVNKARLQSESLVLLIKPSFVSQLSCSHWLMAGRCGEEKAEEQSCPNITGGLGLCKQPQTDLIHHSRSKLKKVKQGAEDPPDTTRHQGARNPHNLVLRSFFPQQKDQASVCYPVNF